MPENKLSRQPVRGSRVVLFIGLTLLIIGLALTLYNFAVTRRGSKQSKQTPDLNAELAGAEPRFEIGYTSIRLDLFRELQAKQGDAVQQEVTDLLSYPILSNEVEARINSNSPPITPNFVNLPLQGDDLRDFKSLSRRKKVKLREVNVVCLVVKQVGKGKAEKVVLTSDKSVIEGGAYMFDYTELGWDDEAPAEGTTDTSIASREGKEAHHTFELGTMDTGSAFIIPLYLTNLFDRLDGGIEPPGWEIVSGTVFTPVAVHYKKAGTETVTQLSVKDVFTLPLVIRSDR